MENKDSYKKAEWKLYSYKENIVKLKNLTQEIEREQNNNYNIRAMSYEERITSTNLVSSAVEDEVIRRDEKLRRLQQEKSNIECDIKQVENVLAILSEEDKKLIEERYFKKKTYLQLTQVFPYSTTGIANITKRIIRKIEGLLVF